MELPHPPRAGSATMSTMALFEVECPCCNALLKIDPDTRAIIAHSEKSEGRASRIGTAWGPYPGSSASSFSTAATVSRR